MPPPGGKLPGLSPKQESAAAAFESVGSIASGFSHSAVGGTTDNPGHESADLYGLGKRGGQKMASRPNII